MWHVPHLKTIDFGANFKFHFFEKIFGKN